MIDFLVKLSGNRKNGSLKQDSHDETTRRNKKERKLPSLIFLRTLAFEKCSAEKRNRPLEVLNKKSEAWLGKTKKLSREFTTWMKTL